MEFGRLRKTRLKRWGEQGKAGTSKDLPGTGSDIATYIDHREARSRSSLKRYHLYNAARQSGTV
jgi:hypothetical protein